MKHAIPRVSIDFDGVITDPHALKAAELRRLGYAVAPAQTGRRYAIERLGIPKEAYEEATYHANCTRIEEMPLAPGARVGLDALISCGIHPIVVTARSPEECRPAHDFIERHGLPIFEVHSSHGRSKATRLDETLPLFHVDDTPSHLEELRQSLPEVEPLLFRNLANEWWIAENPGAFSVVGWPGVVRAAQRLLAESEPVNTLGKELGCRAS